MDDVDDTVKDIGRGVLQGVDEAVEQLYRTAGLQEFGDWLEQKTGGPIMVRKPETTAGQIAAPLVQGSVAMIPAAKAVKALGVASSFLQWTLGGAFADFAAFAPEEPGIADITATLGDLPQPQMEAVRREIEDWLGKDESDSDLKKRLKGAVEGAVIGGVLDGVIRTARAAKKTLFALGTGVATSALSSDEAEAGPAREIFKALIKKGAGKDLVKKGVDLPVEAIGPKGPTVSRRKFLKGAGGVAAQAVLPGKGKIISDLISGGTRIASKILPKPNLDVFNLMKGGIELEFDPNLLKENEGFLSTVADSVRDIPVGKREQVMNESISMARKFAEKGDFSFEAFERFDKNLKARTGLDFTQMEAEDALDWVDFMEEVSIEIPHIKNFKIVESTVQEAEKLGKQLENNKTVKKMLRDFGFELDTSGSFPTIKNRGWNLGYLLKEDKNGKIWFNAIDTDKATPFDSMDELIEEIHIREDRLHHPSGAILEEIGGSTDLEPIKKVLVDLNLKLRFLDRALSFIEDSEGNVKASIRKTDDDKLLIEFDSDKDQVIIDNIDEIGGVIKRREEAIKRREK